MSQSVRRILFRIGAAAAVVCALALGGWYLASGANHASTVTVYNRSGHWLTNIAVSWMQENRKIWWLSPHGSGRVRFFPSGVGEVAVSFRTPSGSTVGAVIPDPELAGPAETLVEHFEVTATIGPDWQVKSQVLAGGATTRPDGVVAPHLTANPPN